MGKSRRLRSRSLSCRGRQAILGCWFIHSYMPSS
jgi:hypothetical protein